MPVDKEDRIGAENGAEDRETYTHGYDTALTLKLHAGRSAAVQARWFLPYLQPGMSLLDCGCGSGSITVGLAEAVASGEAVGIDLSEIEIQRARERAVAADVRNVQFSLGNLYRLDFPDNTFDALFSHNVLEHVRDPLRALQEMRRVLKPDGVIGLRDIDLDGHLLAPADPILHQWLEIYKVDWTRNGGHPQLGRQLRGLLNQAGFEVLDSSASYETYSDPESRRFIAQVAASRLVEPDYVERVLRTGLASREQLAAIHAVWLDWPERPDAFLAQAHAEAVGRKRLH